MASGIYRILNMETGHQYIGSSIDMEKRFGQHRRALCKGKHHSRYLQRAWNKYGQEKFKFEALWQTDSDRESLLYEEQLALNLIKSEYNISPIASSGGILNKGRRHTSETRKKVSCANRGKIRTPEHREKYSAAARRRCAKNPEQLSNSLAAAHKKNMIAIEMINLTTGEAKEYESLSSASADGFRKTSLSRAMKRNQHSYNGYHIRRINL